MPGPEILLWGVLLPAALAAVLPLLLSVLSGSRSGRIAAVGGTLGLAAGYLTGYWLVAGRPGFPPLDVGEWTFWLAAAAAAAATPEALSPRPARWRWPLRILLAGSTAILFAGPRFGWSTAAAAGWMAGLGAGLLLWWTLLERISGPSPGVPALAVWYATAGGAVAAVLLSGSESIARLGLPLAGALGGVAAAVALRRRPILAGATGPVVTVLAAVLSYAHLYSDLPASSALLVALAPVSGLAVLRGLTGRTGPFRAAGFALGAALLPLAGAVGIAWQNSPPF